MLEAVIVISLTCAAGASGQIIDDFESYADTGELAAVWTGTVLDTVTVTLAPGSQSLSREDLDVAPGSSSLTLRDFDPALDLSGLPGLEVWVRRIFPLNADIRFNLLVWDAGFSDNCASPSTTITDSFKWHRILLSFPDHCDELDVSQIMRIQFIVSNNGPTQGVLVNFDHLAVAMLQDGFESADTSRWSLTVP
jgi:hypothetical protein